MFAGFALIHLLAWGATHIWLTTRPPTVLVVADTSFALKPQFAAMQRWIEDYESTGRYRKVLIGTDKALLGNLADIRSHESIFRTAFGRSNADDLRQFETVDARERIFLSDGSIESDGWTLVRFPQ